MSKISSPLPEGNLVITTPSTFWHKDVARRLLLLLLSELEAEYRARGVG